MKNQKNKTKKTIKKKYKSNKIKNKVGSGNEFKNFNEIPFLDELLNQDQSDIIDEEYKHIKVPENFKCPITHSLMLYPVNCSDGKIYESYAINKALKKYGRSPFTRKKSDIIGPNKELENKIYTFVLENYKVYLDKNTKNNIIKLRYKNEPNEIESHSPQDQLQLNQQRVLRNLLRNQARQESTSSFSRSFGWLFS